jgi:hypothetical protein
LFPITAQHKLFGIYPTRNMMSYNLSYAHACTHVFLPCLGSSSRHLPLKIAAPAKQGLLLHWKFSKVHTGPQFARGFQTSVCIRLYNKIVQATSRSHTKSVKVKVKVRVTLRLTVYHQSVRLSIKPLETHDQRSPPAEPLQW